MTCTQPGCANPEDKVWQPTLTALWHNGTSRKGSQGGSEGGSHGGSESGSEDGSKSGRKGGSEGGSQGGSESGSEGGTKCRVVLELAFEAEAHAKYGAPGRAFVDYTLGPSSLTAKLTWWVIVSVWGV